MSHADRWRIGPGVRPDLVAIDPAGTEGAPGDRAATEEETSALAERLADLQGRLWAEGGRSLLVVLQAMDAGGKDGTVKRVFRAMNPMGIEATAFKAPNDAELAHDFLWRIHGALPERGKVGILNRSHYEDVLVVRVEELVPESVWRPRYEAIRCFEEMLVAEGTTVVKLFLHISKEEQAERFRARLADPAKNWKFSVGDLDVRARWDDYRAAYTDAMEETSTAGAPWFVVPADRKWYRNWVVSRILVDALEAMDPRYPAPAEDLDRIVID